MAKRTKAETVLPITSELLAVRLLKALRDDLHRVQDRLVALEARTNHFGTEAMAAYHVPREALARAKDYVLSEHHNLSTEYAELIATIEPLEALFRENPEADLVA
jgi:hypothetical protein